METTLNKWSRMRISDRSKLTLVDIICYLFVLLFVYTASGKFMTIDTFIRVLSHYPIIGNYNHFVAYLVPIVELVIALALLIPASKKYGIIASLLLMIAFLAYIIYMFYTGSDLPCSCGGIISKLSWKDHIWFNSLMILLAGFALKIYK